MYFGCISTYILPLQTIFTYVAPNYLLVLSGVLTLCYMLIHYSLHSPYIVLTQCDLSDVLGT